MGEHLKRARMDRGTRQKEVARMLGCEPSTLGSWENGAVAPDIRFWPAILDYLAYGPRPEPKGFGGRLKRAREDEGLTKRDLARRLGLNLSTISAWEGGNVRRPYPRIRRVFERWLASRGDKKAGRRP